MESCIICGERESIKEFQIKETEWCIDCLKQHNDAKLRCSLLQQYKKL